MRDCNCHITMYVTAARKASANTLFDGHFSTSGVEYFGTGISTNGLTPASAYCMGFYANANSRNFFENNATGVPGVKWDIRDLNNNILDTNLNPGTRIGQTSSPSQGISNTGFQFIAPTSV